MVRDYLLAAAPLARRAPAFPFFAACLAAVGGCGSILGINDGLPDPDAGADVISPGDDADGSTDAANDGILGDGGPCKPGSVQCLGNAIQSCDTSGKWQTMTSCSGTTPVCLDAGCVACAPGSTQCASGGVQTCGASGTWGGTVDCTDQACVSGKCTGVCAPNQDQCSGNSVQTCDTSGVWQTTSSCPDQTCVDGKCTGACAPGQVMCGSDEMSV